MELSIQAFFVFFLRFFVTAVPQNDSKDYTPMSFWAQRRISKQLLRTLRMISFFWDWFEIQDYVIIHELCHLKELNHSSAFWKEVEKYCPDYKAHRNWLKNNGVGYNQKNNTHRQRVGVSRCYAFVLRRSRHLLLLTFYLLLPKNPVRSFRTR